MKRVIRWTLIGLVSVGLFACSGGDDASGDGSSNEGYNGATSAATVNDSNKNDMARASSVGAEKAIESSSAPGRTLTRNNTHSIEYLLETSSITITNMRKSRMQSRAVVDLTSSVCPSGGSASYTYDESSTSAYGSFTINYNNCSYNYGGITSTVDGSAVWTTNEDGSFSYVYDLTTTYGTETYHISATYECDAEFNCSYSDEFSFDGVSYRVGDISVSGSSSLGFNVSAKVYHEDYGYITIEATDLISCSSGGFSSGRIVVEDSTNSDVLEVDFVSCSQMTVTFNGVATTVEQ